jgi:hypothetical protein
MDDMLALPPNLPPHDKTPLQPVPHRAIAEWPEGTFLENPAVLDDGDIAVALMTAARIDPVSLYGSRSTRIQLSEPPTGLSVVGEILYAMAGEPTASMWFSEFSEPFEAFRQAGCEITVASPLGSPAPVDLRGYPKAEESSRKIAGRAAASHRCRARQDNKLRGIIV